jgi:hypothetical protein
MVGAGLVSRLLPILQAPWHLDCTIGEQMRGAEDTRQAVCSVRLRRARSLTREAALPAHDKGMNKGMNKISSEWDDLMTLVGVFP